jgi:hypothetical protein
LAEALHRPLDAATDLLNLPASDFDRQASERMQAARGTQRDLLAEAGVQTAELGDLKARYAQKPEIQTAPDSAVQDDSRGAMSR